jgi:hypothetical protein
MELALAAGGAALFSAVAAAVKDSPQFSEAWTGATKHVRLLLTPNAPEARLRAALRGLSAAYDATRRSLDGSRRGMTSADLMRVAAALRGVPPGTVVKLNLSHTVIEQDVALALAQGHACLADLGALRLRGCALGDESVAALCASLHHPSAASSSQLSELALASNRLSSAAAAAIAEAVLELPALQTLDLSYNALGHAGCASIGEALAERRSLQTLSLASVGLDDSGVVALATLLSEVPLLDLDLDGNSAGDGAVGALLGMAARSNVLSSLRLSANEVSLTGALAVAAHLVARPSGSLRSLALSNNPLTVEGADALSGALRSNSSLAELSLTGTGATVETVLTVNELVARNRAAARQQSRAHTKSLLRAASAQAAQHEDYGREPLAPVGRAASTAVQGAPGTSLGASIDEQPQLPQGSKAHLPVAPKTPADAPVSNSQSAELSSRDFQTPVLFASAHAASVGLQRFSPSFAPTGDLSAGVVRQRRELHVLPSARIILLDNTGLRSDLAPLPPPLPRSIRPAPTDLSFTPPPPHPV